MNRSKVAGSAAIVTLVAGIGYGGYTAGQHQGSKIRWYSEMIEKTQGTKRYLIDGNVVCSNGKDLGKFQVDMDLTSGKLRVVRLDNQRTVDCYLDRPIMPQYPAPGTVPPPEAVKPPTPTPVPPSPPVKK